MTTSSIPSARPQLSLIYLRQLTSDPTISPTIVVDKLSHIEANADQDLCDSTKDLITIYYTCYFFSLILDNDLNEARFLSQRINKSLLESETALTSVYTILRALWSRKHTVFYQTLTNYPWDEIVSPLVQRVLESHRQRTTALLSDAYTSILPSRAALYLGYESDEQVIAALVNNSNMTERWTYDEQNLVLIPPANKLDIVKTKRGDRQMEDDTDGQIARLVKLVGSLSDM